MKMNEIEKEYVFKLKELRKKEYIYNIGEMKTFLYGLADELYGLFKGLYNAFHFTDDQFITEEEKKILNEIIAIAREKAFSTSFCGVSSHGIEEAIKRIKELINKYIEMCIKNLSDNQTIIHKNNEKIIYKLK